MQIVVPEKDDPDTAAHLEETHLGQVVEVEGRWVPPAGSQGSGSLAVTAITGAYDPAKEK